MMAAQIGIVKMVPVAVSPPGSSSSSGSTVSHKMSTRKQSWQQIANTEYAARSAKIPNALRLQPSVIQSVFAYAGPVLEFPRQCSILTQAEVRLTEDHDATSLLHEIAAGRVTSVAVTTAFCKRAAIAQQLVNCLTEIMFEEALSRAAYCDEYLAREKKVLGPFHGLPISFQDSFNIKGLCSTLGYLDFLRHEPATDNSALVDVMLSQGAVLYLKTNVSQTMRASDTHNNLFGRTSNPHKIGLTTGGAAGGEAALIAMRGSLLGVGNDNCGGLRLPALCCGLVGFKPSSRRIPSSGQKLAGRWGNFGIISSAGTISHSVRDARYFMQNILQFDCWSVDEDVLSVPWRATFESVPKRFGVIFEDPEYPLHPYVFRNLQDALMRITAAGHQVIPMDNILPHDIISTTAFTAMTVLNMDPEKTPLGFVARGGEPLVPSISAATMPGLANMKPNINGVFNLNNDISRIRSIFREAIVQNNLDAIIMPGYQATAVAHDLMEVPAYAVLANLLDYPACVLPYGKAVETLDAPYFRNVPYQPNVDPEMVEGAPCSIQIIGRNMKDEELLDCAQIIENILKT